MNQDDWIDNLLDEQARRNAAFQAQVDTVTDVAQVPQTGYENIGFTESMTTTNTHGPHKWGDSQTSYGFWQWGN